MAPRILIVDDEAPIRRVVGDHLGASGFEVLEAGTCAAGLERFIDGHPDAVVLDHQLPDGTALDLLPRLRALRPFVPVVVVTGHGSIDLAVACVKEGAEQFLTKPAELPALQIALERAIDAQRLRRREAGARSAAPPDPFLGVSPGIRALAADARRVARADSPILITGETGTGKGVLAAWLHRASHRASEPMVSLNCAALSHALLESELFGHERGAFTGAISAKPGMLEVANRGTVFLDEIGDMDAAIQPRLLKVLEEQRFRRVGEVRDRVVDVRLVAATHQDLAARVADGRFRSDLYFRVNTIPLRLPPLRERVEDIPILADWMLDRLRVELGRPGLALSEEAHAALAGHPWPGNLRELRNVLERAVLLSESGRLQAADLRLGPAAGGSGERAREGMTLAEVEREHVQRVVEACGGRVEEAAARLGLSRSSLYERLKRYAQGAEAAPRSTPKR
ncbi:MAG TPA: sigma-54 dependent transcriptional regulator [Anaeromyxobacteraceae bacterium]|nr:sigma-54 dependent transcriptional regulator [Anaeromyxobacteraceae bacterium]